MDKLLQTQGVAALILRLTLGLVMLSHGYQKISNFESVLHHLTADYYVPYLLSVMVILIEFFASLLLVAGLGARIMAFLLALVMAGAIFKGGHWEIGFFMNWFGKQKGEGYEYHLLAIGISLAIMILGSGKWSLDLLIFNNMRKKNQQL